MPAPIVIASIDIRYRPTPKGAYVTNNFPEALCVGDTLKEMHKRPDNIIHAMKHRDNKVHKWIKIVYYDAQIVRCEVIKHIGITNE